MARSRTIKPAFFSNEELSELSAGTRLLFIGLWTIADRNGRLEDRPKRIKAELFPYDDIDLEEGLSKLHNAGFIDRYLSNGTKVVLIKNFVKHQNCHPSEKPSDLPDKLKPAENSEAIISNCTEIISHGNAVRKKDEKCLLPITSNPITSNPITSNPIIDSPSPVMGEKEKTKNKPKRLLVFGSWIRLNEKDYKAFFARYSDGGQLFGKPYDNFENFLKENDQYISTQPPEKQAGWFNFLNRKIQKIEDSRVDASIKT